MRGVFDDEQLAPVQARRETELTLGSGTLLVAFFGLVLLCGLCFGLGYAVGHRGSQSSATEAPPATVSVPSPGSSIAKPSATTQAPVAPAADGSDSDSTGAASGVAPASVSEAPASTEPGASSPAPVRPALASTTLVTPAGQPATASNVHPAIAPAVQLMVQIAAVSNPEDAEVLTNALRRRGYLVTVRRDPADNLIHVRIGPFSSLIEASSWRTKLLNDGYNAIVQ